MDKNLIFLLDYRPAFMLNQHVIKTERVVELGVCNRNIDFMSFTRISLLIFFHSNKTSVTVMICYGARNRGSILGRNKGSS
jgi:hypothetical protein